MYKCTECGLEFENKPDYCDCGNDEFVLTVQEQEKPDETPVKAEANPAPAERSISAEEYFGKRAGQNVNYNNYPDTAEWHKLPVSPIAIYVFAVCIIYSFYILFFWNPVTQTTEKITKVIEKAENITVPSIDKLWKEPEPAKTLPQSSPAENKPKTAPVTQNVKNNVQKPATNQVAASKTNNTAKSKPAVRPNTSNSKPAQAAKPVQQQQTVADDAAKKAAEAAKKAADAAKKAEEAKQKAEAEAMKAAEQARKNALAKQELHSYKINLRNAIGQKIDFTRVIGDGDCAVTFKMDSTGRLINRVFAKQSSNITLNNAVYNAVMAVPSFNPPPSGYGNETMTLNVIFKNGNFAITLE